MSADQPPVVPEWLEQLVAGVQGVAASDLSRFAPPPGQPARASAVLVLVADGDRGPDVLLIERAPDMRAHAGQPAFPGGAIDHGDAGPVEAALREATEETGVDPESVVVLAQLPELWVPPSGFAVTPVLGFWVRPGPVRAVDPAEVARVVRVPISELADPANRVWVRNRSGFVGPGFTVAGMVVWGFTAGLLDRLLHLAGWERPWPDAPEVAV